MNAIRIGMIVSAFGTLACASDTRVEPEVSPREELGASSHELRAGGRTNPCDVVRCRSGFVCQVSGGLPACVPDELSPKDPSMIECKTDADCTSVADYCGGCNCLALASGESAPLCERDEVACFSWPCLGLAAFCDEGQCTVDAQR